MKAAVAVIIFLALRPPPARALDAPSKARDASSAQKQASGELPGVSNEVQGAVSRAAEQAAEAVVKQGGSKEEATTAAQSAAAAAVRAANNLQRQNPSASPSALAKAAHDAAQPIIQAYAKNKDASGDGLVAKAASSGGLVAKAAGADIAGFNEAQMAIFNASVDADKAVLKQGATLEEETVASENAALAAVIAANKLQRDNPNASQAAIAKAAHGAAQPIIQAYSKNKNANVDDLVAKAASGGRYNQVDLAVYRAGLQAGLAVVNQGGSMQELRTAFQNAANAAVGGGNRAFHQNPNIDPKALAKAASDAAQPIIAAYSRNKNANVDGLVAKATAGPKVAPNASGGRVPPPPPAAPAGRPAGSG